MSSWTGIGYQMRFRGIERAYRESHRTFEKEVAGWTARWERHLAEREAGQVDDGQADYGEHVGEGIFDAEQSLQSVREAFMLVLYHFWEHQACMHLGMSRYNQGKIFEAARQAGNFAVDETGVNWVRTVANCIKHGDGALHSDSPELFDHVLIEAGGDDPGYRTALRLRDEDIERAFAAVRASGPRHSGAVLLIDQSGAPKAILGRGEHKSIQTDRVVLDLGPPEEVEMVRRVYRLFVHDGRFEKDIAQMLNAEGALTDLGRPWSQGTVHQILINEKYLGNNVWNRVSFKLKKKRVKNDPEMWIRSDGVFPAIVDRNIFDAAQTIIKTRSIKLTDEELLDALRGLCDRAGVLSGMTIDEADEMPSSSAYRSRFGSLLRAYQLIGYRPRRDYRYIEINRALRAQHPGIVAEVTAAFRQWGSAVSASATTDLLTVNGEFTASVVIAKCRRTPAGSYRWRLRFDHGLIPDITIVVRMAANNVDALDYYLLPSIDLARGNLKLAEENGLGIDGYRFEDLNEFYAFVSPVNLREAA